jgi:hypothetical protein
MATGVGPLAARRTIWVAMIVGGVATVFSLASKPSKDRIPLWRVGIAWPLATFALLVTSEVAPNIASGFAITYAAASLLGGKAVADSIDHVLTGFTFSGKTPPKPKGSTTPPPAGGSKGSGGGSSHSSGGGGGGGGGSLIPSIPIPGFPGGIL